MPKNIIIREDFRRDGLFANFLVDEEIMVLVARAFPGSILQVGYPAICSMEREMCFKILFALQNENIEPALSGHAIREHLDIMGDLLKPYPKATANFWIPVSDYMIARTLKWNAQQVLDHALNLLDYWHRNYPHNVMDVALVDCTENEEGIEERIALFTNGLHDAGARSVVICDTKGQSYPDRLKKLFETIRKYGEGEIEFHPHNDNGRGFENVKAAIEYGITTIGTALFNVGERFSMLDPRDFVSNFILIDYESQYLKNIEELYEEKVGKTPADIRKLFAENVIITGTQYRLFGRNEDAKLLFGITTDKYILGKFLNIEEKKISSELIEWFKNELVEGQKIFYSKQEVKSIYSEFDDSLKNLVLR